MSCWASPRRSRISTLSRKSICFYCFWCRLFALHRYFLLYHTLRRSWSSNGKNAEFTKVHWKSYALCRKVVWKSCNFDKNSLEKMRNLSKVPWKKSNGRKNRLKNHLPFLFMFYCLLFLWKQRIDKKIISALCRLTVTNKFATI